MHLMMAIYSFSLLFPAIPHLNDSVSHWFIANGLALVSILLLLVATIVLSLLAVIHLYLASSNQVLNPCHD
jgi:hypothetical protein